MLRIVLMTTLEQWGLTLPPATSLHPAVLAMQPHLPSLSVGTLSICQLQSHAVCPVLSGPLAPGCVGWANRPQALSSPQSHHPVKPDADPGMKLLYCLLSLREGSPALSNLTQPFKTRENSAHAHTHTISRLWRKWLWAEGQKQVNLADLGTLRCHCLSDEKAFNSQSDDCLGSHHALL